MAPEQRQQLVEDFGPEVASINQGWAPEVITNRASHAPQALYEPGKPVVYQQEKQQANTTYVPDDGGERRRELLFCGLRPTTFWLIKALIFAILAAVAAGVTAGVLHSKTSQSCQNPTALADRNSSASTIASTCAREIDGNTAIFRSNLTGSSYAKHCFSAPDLSLIHGFPLVTAFARSFDQCITICDSYDFWTGTKNMTTVNWNWGGQYGQNPGTCWCIQVPMGQSGGYDLNATELQDTAKLVVSGAD